MKATIRTSLVLLTGIFLVSRLCFHLAGIRFDAGTLECFFQILDPELLRHDLLRSVFYLHSQPPLFNLGIGLVLQAFPGAEVTVFAIIALLMGLTLTWAMFLLMVRLGVSHPIGVIATTIVIIGPQTVLYENWLYYTYAVGVMVTLSALLLHRYLDSGLPRDGSIFFAMIACIVLTRSLFHLVWLVAVAGALMYIWREERKAIVRVALLPFLVVLGLYVKNAVIADSFSSSSWMGMNLSRKTTFLMPEQLRREEVARGELSPVALIPSFNGLTAYDHIPYTRAQTGIPALDQVWKAPLCPNLNNLAYVELSKMYMADALHVITQHPEFYLKGCALGLFTFALPSSNFYFLKENRERIYGYERFYNLLIFGQILPFESATLDDTAEGYVGGKLLIRGWFLVIGLPLLFWYGWRRARRASPDELAFRGTLWFMLGTIAYVTLVGNAVELAENNRFRFTFEPLLAVLAAMACQSLWRRWRVRQPHTSPNPDAA